MQIWHFKLDILICIQTKHLGQLETPQTHSPNASLSAGEDSWWCLLIVFVLYSAVPVFVCSRRTLSAGTQRRVFLWNVKFHWHMFNPLCCFSLYMHVTVPCPMPLWHNTTHSGHASHMICAARPRQMAHWISPGQWHCSFDIIPKHWLPLQYPLLPSLYDHIARAPSSTSMCCLLWCFYWLKIRVLKDCWRLAALIFWSADTSAFSLVQMRYMICWCGIDAAFLL